MEPENNINDLRVDSFSCYLKPIEGLVNMFEANERFTDMTPSIGSNTRSYSNNHGPLVNQKLSRDKRWFHGCKGPCSTKKAVYVPQSIKKGDFTFPVLINPTMEIEVFGSGTVHKGDIANSLLKNVSFFTWDVIPKSKESVVCDDMASEGSSGLFEIENVSITGWKPSESRFMSPSTQYAPSKASMEWSVYSGYEEKQTVYNTRAKTKIEPQKNSKKNLDNGLLGCNGFKSVKVVEPLSRTTDKPLNIRCI